MRTREKLRVDVKVRCLGCGASRVAGNATIAPGTRFEQTCRTCGGRIAKTISQADIDKAIADHLEMKEVTKRLAERTSSSPPITYRKPKGKKVKKQEPARELRRKRVASDQVTGAAKLYHYAVYVRHPWGTDRIVVGIKKRDIQTARDTAWDRVGSKRRTGDMKILDAVPMRWTPDGFVEVRRRTTVKKGNLKNARRPKARATNRQNKQKVNR